MKSFNKKIRKGELIIKEGEDGNCAYLIDMGRVEVFLETPGEATIVGILGVGEIFGEMAIIDGSKRAASARAVEDCELSIVSKEQLSERIEQSDPVVRLLIGILLKRMRDSLKREKLMSVEMTNVGIKMGQDMPKKGLAKPNTTPLTPKDHETTGKIDLASLAKKAKANDTVIDKIRLEKELQQALLNNEFMLYYQPILNLQKNSIAGVEALMRWNNKDLGMVRPDIFMGIAEETSLIVPLGQWIVRKACEEFSRLLNFLKQTYGKAPADMFVSINISGRQLKDPMLFEVLQRSCWRGQIQPGQIKLEITERVLVEGNFVFDWIKKCRSYGFSIALDDFGTGYSSLSYLNRLDVNNIKIDRSFIKDIQRNESTKVIVNSIIEMSRGLKKSVVAEGIETIEQHNSLKAANCTYGQGYFYSRPVSMDDLIEFVTKTAQKKAA